jgi:putative CocE/NonD family hydrolase
MVRFFDAHLKDNQNSDEGLNQRTLFYYTMGEEKWKSTPTWPPVGTKEQVWYLSNDNALVFEKPQVESGADFYKVDFSATSGRDNRWYELGSLLNRTVRYQNRAEAGRTMLTYFTPPLKRDIEISGYPVVQLYISSTETDGAFFVYLEDVDEQGSVTYVTEGQLRALHRKVSESPPPYVVQVPYHTYKAADAMPLVPGEIAELHFGLLPTSVLIREGHRLRLGIACHDEGTFSRIPPEGEPLIRVLRDNKYASNIRIPTVEKT